MRLTIRVNKYHEIECYRVFISSLRITINFCDRAPYEIGYNGTTIQVIRAQRAAAAAKK